MKRRPIDPERIEALMLVSFLVGKLRPLERENAYDRIGQREGHFHLLALLDRRPDLCSVLRGFR